MKDRGGESISTFICLVAIPLLNAVAWGFEHIKESNLEMSGPPPVRSIAGLWLALWFLRISRLRCCSFGRCRCWGLVHFQWSPRRKRSGHHRLTGIRTEVFYLPKKKESEDKVKWTPVHACKQVCECACGSGRDRTWARVRGEEGQGQDFRSPAGSLQGCQVKHHKMWFWKILDTRYHGGKAMIDLPPVGLCLLMTLDDFLHQEEGECTHVKPVAKVHAGQRLDVKQCSSQDARVHLHTRPSFTLDNVISSDTRFHCVIWSFFSLFNG